MCELINYDNYSKLPFLRILEPHSPQSNPNNTNFISEAKVGDIYHSVSNQCWGGNEGIKVVPFGYDFKFFEFESVEGKLTFIKEISSRSPDIGNTIRNGTKEILPSGNELIRTAFHHVLIVDDNNHVTGAICDFKKFQMKVSRQWNNQMRLITYHTSQGTINPPMWGTAWKISVIEESVREKQRFNYEVRSIAPIEVPQEIFLKARDLYCKLTSVNIKF